MAFTLQAACLSHIGNRRGNNEDNFFFNGICLEEEHTSTHDPLLMERVLQEDVCLGVFDGMGGENYGEQASFTAASEMQALTGKPKLFYQSGGKYLGNLALALNDAVFRRAQELMTSRMGTTMAALYFPETASTSATWATAGSTGCGTMCSPSCLRIMYPRVSRRRGGKRP